MARKERSERATRYRVRTGMHYMDAGGQMHRAEPGDVIADVLPKSLEWLVPQGHLEPLGNDAPPTDDETEGA